MKALKTPLLLMIIILSATTAKAAPSYDKMNYSTKLNIDQHSEQEAACFFTVRLIAKTANIRKPVFRFVQTDNKDEPIIDLTTAGRTDHMPCLVNIEKHSVQLYKKDSRELSEAYYTYQKSGDTYSVHMGY